MSIVLVNCSSASVVWNKFDLLKAADIVNSLQQAEITGYTSARFLLYSQYSTIAYTLLEGGGQMSSGDRW